MTVAQVMHSGRIGHPALYPSGHQPVAPSPIAAAGQAFSPQGPLDYPVPRELSLNEIAATVTDFALSARLAIEAGFDAVELQAGNGFLLHQFLADGINQRSDAYGGSIAARIRFPVEVIEAVADVIGPEQLGLRISPGNPYNGIAESDTEQLYGALLRSLPSIAYLHIMEAGTRVHTLAVREQWAGALIVNPHADAHAPAVNPEIAQQVLHDDLADAVCLGALFLANPDLPERIRLGGPYNAPDPATFYGGDERGYTDYPTLEPQ